MALDSKHPQYTENVATWELMRDSYGGERAVKAKGSRYLPPTSGMWADGMNVDQPGWKAYQAYVVRAVYHDFVKEAVETLIGVMHHKPPTIELPPQMEGMLEKATVQGESLQVLLRRINEAQLTTGRIGLMLDIPKEPPAGVKPQPYIATYAAETILNWDVGRVDDDTLPTLNFVCLNETEYERNADYEWEKVNKYRVLLLGDPVVTENANAGAMYKTALFSASGQGVPAFNAGDLIEPSLMGRKLEELPFVIVNATDIVPAPNAPPLEGLANLSMAIYRGEADYRQSLFMQGQDTLVTIGYTNEEGKPLRVGAGARLDIPSGPGNDAKYIGVSSDGLSEQRECLDADKKEASARGGQLLDTTSREKESGDALKTRVSARTATLNQIALAGAYGLQTMLRIGATWMGADPLKVIVKPNLDFDAAPMTGTDLLSYQGAKNQGAPIARETIHALMRAKGVTELTYEEEMALIDTEEPLSPGVMLPVDPNAKKDEEEELPPT